MDKERNMKIFCLLLAAGCSPVFSADWKAKVVGNLDTLVGSCVVVPCSFNQPDENLPTSRLRGIWQRSHKRDEIIYYEDNTRVLENFRGRTKLVGDLGQKNCTLEMIKIQNHDNGPFCFRVELARTETDTDTKDKYSFVEDCVHLNMLPGPPKPQLVHPETANEGRPYAVKCSVTHTCPSHPPKFTWSRSSVDGIIGAHREIHSGYWVSESILMFIPEGKDDHSEITCTAEFNGQMTSSATLKLYIKRTEDYKHIIIPAVVGICTSVILGLFCIFMVKKYKTRIAELQSQDGSMWNRLSRMSRRFRSAGPGPSRSEQRPNNVHSQSCADQKVSKPRFPSPKSQPKSSSYKEDLDGDDDYINTADLNVYGNI